MAALISTYRHDYTPPVTNRYNFLKQVVQVSTDPCHNICPCVEEIPKPKLTALGEVCETKQWTGIAPPGKMPVPRVVPEAPLTAKEDKKDTCWLDQPNRFLKTISNTYPELYERLRNMPQDELRRSIENSRFRSTYQVDYCHLNEHSKGAYGDSKESKDEEQYRNEKRAEPCQLFDMPDYQLKRTGGTGGGFGENGGFGPGGGDGGAYGPEMTADEVNMYKPVKARFTEDNSRGPTAHWDSGAFTKQMNLTEYMDTMGRTGLVIMENNLHDHSNCMNGRNCTHVVKNASSKGLKLMLNSQL